MLRPLIVIALLLTIPTTSVAQFSQNPNDEDGDGLLNTEEDRNGDGIVNSGETDPYDADTDGGGEADGSEIQAGRNPLDRTDDITYDLDGDGLTNGQEDKLGTDRSLQDSDGDGINDQDDPFPLQKEYKQDTDGDGLPDEYELDQKLERDKRSDAQQDQDGDGLTNLQEFLYGTDMNDSDTDQDGELDGKEVELGRDPLENPCLYHAGPSDKLHDLEGHWSKPFISVLNQMKSGEGGPRIVSGYQTPTGALFKPDQEISRFELLKIAMLSSCITPEETTGSGFVFTDVNKTPRPHESDDTTSKRNIIYTAYALGIIDGYQDGSFKPDASVNRAEALKILISTAKLKPFDSFDYNGEFTDVALHTWYEPYLETALSYDFVSGYEDGTFKPGQPITRAEAGKVTVFIMISNPRVNGYVVPVDDLEL